MFTYVCISWYGRQLITIIPHLVPLKKQISRMGACSLICSASSSNCLSVCLSGSVLFLFLTFPVIPSPNSSKGKKASCNCALGVVAVCARKNFDLDYVGTSSTNTGPRPTMVIVRGVQYMHWVMHKCIMVKVRGETKYT